MKYYLDNRLTYKDKEKWLIQYKSDILFKEKLENLQEPDLGLDNFNKIDTVFTEFCKEYESKLIQKPKLNGNKPGKYSILSPRQDLASPIKFQQQNLVLNKSGQNLKTRKQGVVLKSPKKFQDPNMPNDQILKFQLENANFRLQFKSYKQFKQNQKELSRPNQFSLEDKKFEEQINKSQEWQNIQNHIKEQYQKSQNNFSNTQQVQHQSFINPDNKTKQSINPLINYFGNYFIGMMFQALIVRNVEELYGIKLNVSSGIPISEKILDAYGISKQFLNNLQSEEDKRNYIIQTMNSRVDYILKDWSEKIRQKEKKQDQLQKEFQKQQEVQNQNDNDMFDWIHLKTKHEALVKKLRSLVLEKMNDFENQEKLIKVQIKNSKSKNKHLHETALLSGIKQISTREILRLMNNKEGQILDSLISKKSLKKMKTQSNLNNSKEEEFFLDKQSPESFQMVWNEKIEREYQKNKLDAKHMYFGDITSSDWSELAYLPLLQQHNIENKKKVQREAILERYQSGEFLTAQELKFIADTSKLLNSCIDKNSLQKNMNIVDPESIHHLETNLAESIIQNYENIKKMIQKSRLEFMKKQVKTLQTGNDNTQKKWDHESNFQQRKKEHVKMTKLLKRKIENATTGNYYRDMYNKNFYVKIFVNCIKDKLANRRQIIQDYEEAQQIQDEENANKSNQQKESDYLLRRYELKIRQEQHLKKLAVDQVQEQRNIKSIKKIHELHPPSKVQFFPQEKRQQHVTLASDNDEEEEDFETINIRKRKEYMKKKIQQFKLGLKNKTYSKVSSQFAHYYSGGPLHEKHALLNQNNPKSIQVTPYELNCIVKLQKYYKRYRMRKVIKEIKNKEYNQKYKEYYSKLLSLNQGQKIHDIVKNYSIQIKERKKQEYLQQQLQKQLQIQIQKNQLQQQQHIPFSNRYNQQPNSQEIPKQPQKILQTNDSLENNSLLNSKIQIQSAKNEQFQKSKTISTENQVYLKKGFQSKNLQSTSSQQFKPFQIIKPNSTKNKIFSNNTQQQLSKQFNTNISTQMSEDRSLQNINEIQKKPQLPFRGLSSDYKRKFDMLMLAVKNKCFNTFQTNKFTYNKDDLRQYDQFKNTALYYAVKNSDIPFVHWCLQKQVDPNQMCSLGNTPLHMAFQKDEFTIIGLLLEYGANLNCLNYEGFTPVAYSSRATMVRLQLQDAVVQANPNQPLDFDNNLLLKGDIVFDEKLGKLKIENFYPLADKQKTVKLEVQTSQ